MRARIADGGLIYNMSGKKTEKVCLTAPVAPTPVSGGVLALAKCNDTSDAQKFIYEPSLNLVLASSRAAGRTPMCLDALPKANEYVRFQPCAATPVPRQRWGQNDYSAFEGTTDGVNLNDLCFNVVGQSKPGSLIRLGDKSNDCDNDWTNHKTFFPGPDVGAGRAGRATKQLVNYSQSSRCIDVTADKVSSTFLIIFPCKQVLTGSVQWNQEWTTPAVATGATSGDGRIWTRLPNASTYCLKSPGSTAPKSYVVVRSCTIGSSIPPEEAWTYRLDTGFPNTSYRIQSRYGVTAGGESFCLTLTGPSDYWTEYATEADISKLVLARCDGSDEQKWSVSTFLNRGALTNIVEP